MGVAYFLPMIAQHQTFGNAVIFADWARVASAQKTFEVLAQVRRYDSLARRRTTWGVQVDYYGWRFLTFGEVATYVYRVFEYCDWLFVLWSMANCRPYHDGGLFLVAD